jgi:hypothetical protein
VQDSWLHEHWDQFDEPRDFFQLGAKGLPPLLYANAAVPADRATIDPEETAMTILDTTIAHAIGGRDGRACSDDGRLALVFLEALGGKVERSDLVQLFAGCVASTVAIADRGLDAAAVSAGPAQALRAGRYAYAKAITARRRSPDRDPQLAEVRLRPSLCRSYRKTGSEQETPAGIELRPPGARAGPTCAGRE